MSKTIGNRIKVAREIRGLTQAELGKIGLNLELKQGSSRINQYEKGVHEPKYDVMKKIAKTLKFPIVFFYASTEAQAYALLGMFGPKIQKAFGDYLQARE